ncbi:MAG: ribonucleotide-diphosphate reductase subunit alpha [Prevotellaceae bacterium]|nr:ribonucleotide-diphosphate reductase subunit alpha [Prevotellaceae bacterium]
MKQTDETIQRQLDKPQTWFVKYFPVRIRNTGEKEQKARQLVWDFKDGVASERVAEMTATRMMQEYGSQCSDIVFAPVPASSAEKNELRYKMFCQRVCELTGAVNGYDHVRVVGERLSVHENRKNEKEVRKVNIIDFDAAWFQGKQVLCFDDIITRGHSYALYANQLESFGANVIGGYFLARTHYKVKT